MNSLDQELKDEIIRWIQNSMIIDVKTREEYEGSDRGWVTCRTIIFKLDNKVITTIEI